MTVPSSLLLRYFHIAQRRLQNDTTVEDHETTASAALPANPNLSWHRSRIVEAQIASLDEAISEWQQQNGDNMDAQLTNRDSVQSALRQIGLGDYSCVSYDVNSTNEDILTVSTSTGTGLRSRSSRGKGSGNSSHQEIFEDDNSGQWQRSLLADAVEKTNDLARCAFSRSVLLLEWQLDHSNVPIQTPQSGTGSQENSNIDDGSILEYCGLMLAAVRLPEVQKYLQDGTVITSSTPDECPLDASAEDRLIHIQKLYWRALGWEPSHAMEQLKCLLLGDESAQFSNLKQIMSNAKVMETLIKYASAMTVAATNAVMSNIGDVNDGNALSDDGTTRIISVSYSEKIIGADNDSSNTVHSTSAPTSNTINEHEQSKQRRELDAAKAATMLQQQLWNDFQSLPSHEQTKMVEKAKIVHTDFLEKVTNTPPGRDRVLLMQSIDGEAQKMLVVYKLWCSHISSGAM